MELDAVENDAIEVSMAGEPHRRALSRYRRSPSRKTHNVMHGRWVPYLLRSHMSLYSNHSKMYLLECLTWLTLIGKQKMTPQIR